MQQQSEFMQKQLKQSEFQAYQQQFHQTLRWNNLELLTPILIKYPSLITDDIKPLCYACMWGSDLVIEKLIKVNTEYMNWFQQQLEPILSVESNKFKQVIDDYVLKNYWKAILQEGFETAIYYARPQCLQKILQIAELHKVDLRFDPKNYNDDRSQLTWVMGNIKRGKDGKDVGWHVGPDSGAWPSKLLDDWISIYDTLINKYSAISSYLKGMYKRKVVIEKN